jgi:hypothetical protein
MQAIPLRTPLWWNQCWLLALISYIDLSGLDIQKCKEFVCALCFIASNGPGKFTFISSHEA